MSAIDFLYLDVGGVAIVDFSGTTKFQDFLTTYGMTAQNEAAVMAIWQSHQNEICTTYHADAMIPELTQAGLQFPPDFSLTQAFVAAFEPNPLLWQVVDEFAQQGLRVGLLTNMYWQMLTAIVAANLLDLNKCSVVIDSSVCLLQKPDSAIYKLAQQRAEVAPERILFVDNTPANLVAAAQQGWLTHLFDPTDLTNSCKQLRQLLAANRE